jgi:hypothetical protein
MHAVKHVLFGHFERIINVLPALGASPQTPRVRFAEIADMVFSSLRKELIVSSFN